jgi:hypothetical protein
MRRPAQHVAVSLGPLPRVKAAEHDRTAHEPFEFDDFSEAVADKDSKKVETAMVRQGDLGQLICQRIESRLPGRIRNLAVRISKNNVVLEGQCATFYTKQLAQHAALGVLEDEHLENAIVVTIGPG